MEKENIQKVKFGSHDWVMVFCAVLLTLFGLFLLIGKSNEGVGPLAWGLLLGYFKFKKHSNSKIK